MSHEVKIDTLANGYVRVRTVNGTEATFRLSELPALSREIDAYLVREAAANHLMRHAELGAAPMADWPAAVNDKE